MPKIKTHKGTAKVHNTGSKPTAANRKNRKGSNLSKADQNRLKNLI